MSQKIFLSSLFIERRVNDPGIASAVPLSKLLIGGIMRNLATYSLLIASSITIVSSGCSSPGKKTAIGAGAGAAVGAGVGAIAGGGKGAAIGAGVGGLLGGAVGNRLDKQARELEKVAETQRTTDGILVNLKNDLLFQTGSATLTPEAKTQLNQLGGIMVKYPTNQITVVGHTDDVGSATSNQTLSNQRAAAVQQVLIQSGLPVSRLRTVGMGESQPIAEGTSAATRAKNRRVELKIIDTEGSGGKG